MIGKDMTKMTLPVSFNEPTSLLQRVTEDMVCAFASIFFFLPTTLDECHNLGNKTMLHEQDQSSHPFYAFL